jgi:hypothetical protein
MSDVEIYSSGLCCASVCAPKDMEGDQVADAVNAKRPTGISSRWEISEDKQFKSGEPNPCTCETDPERRHWLLNC